MKRLALLALGLGLAGCLDFRQLITNCQDGGGVCAVDAGDAGAGTGGGGGGGGASFEDFPRAPGGVTPDCDAGTAVTLNPNTPQTAFCFNGFAWVSPLPQGNDLRAVWGASPTDVWAGGAGPSLMHFDGGGWTNFQGTLVADPGGSVEAIVGVGATPLALTVVFPGNRSSLHAWNPLAADAPWSVVSTFGAERLSALAANPDPSDGGLLVALSEQRVVVFAADGGWEDATLSTHAVVKGPNQWGRIGAVAQHNSGRCVFTSQEGTGTGTCQLRDCSGALLLAAGAKGNCSSVWFHGGAPRWTADYSVWDEGAEVVRLDPSGQSMPLVAFAHPNGVGLVVGENRAVWSIPDAGYRPVDPGSVGGRRNDLQLLAVWASADGGAVAVGGAGLIAARQTPTGALTWRSGGVTLDVYAIALEETREVVAGSGGLRWVVGSPAVTGSTTLRDVSPDGDGGFTVVDEEGNVRSWSLGGNLSAPRYSVGGGRLFGLHRQASDDLVVVGGLGNDAHLATWNGATWTPENPDGGLPGKPLWKVHGREGRAWAVGEELTLLERTTRGGRWVRNPPPVASGTSLYGVWMESADAGTGWAVGGGGPYRIVDGFLSDVQPVIEFPLNFFDVWGFDADDVWAVGDDGHVLHLRAGTWEKLESGCSQALERVRGRQYADGSREVFIGGRMGAILRYRYRP